MRKPVGAAAQDVGAGADADEPVVGVDDRHVLESCSTSDSSASSSVSTMPFRDRDYRRLLEFRTALRQFLYWSETQAVAAGITAAQHQLLLAVRGHRGDRGPTVGDVAASQRPSSRAS